MRIKSPSIYNICIYMVRHATIHHELLRFYSHKFTAHTHILYITGTTYTYRYTSSPVMMTSMKLNAEYVYTFDKNAMNKNVFQHIIGVKLRLNYCCFYEILIFYKFRFKLLTFYFLKWAVKVFK